MIGVSFGGCAGWLERGRHPVGVVICPAQGFEELCTRRTIAVLGHKLADAGFSVLRYDYPGTADSLGTHADPGQVAAWRGSIDDALAVLKAETGVSHAVLIGMRLGATLAAFAAEKNDSVVASVLMAPVMSGRVYTREMQALQRFIRPMHYPAGLSVEEGCGIEIGGFKTTPETEADLKALDLMALSRVPKRTLLLTRPATVANDRLKAHLEGLVGDRTASVETRPFTGYDRMMCDPTASTLPEQDLDAILAWLVETCGQAPEPESQPEPEPEHERVAEAAVAAFADQWGRGPAPLARPNAQDAAAAVVVVERDTATPSLGRLSPSGVATKSWREQGLTFGDDNHLVGVLCEPIAPRQDNPSMLFLNSGMDYHAGWARMTVEQARALAEVGVASLRIDVSGIGDSRNARDQAVDAIYRAQALSDARCAVDVLLAKGYAPPTVTGGCSGAYTAFHLLREDQRLNAAVIRNLQVFRWTPEVGYKVRVGLEAHPYEATAKRRSNDPDAPFLDVVRSQIEGGAMRLTRRLRGLRSQLSDRLGLSGKAETANGNPDVVGWFRALSKRGCKVVMVFSDTDAGVLEFTRHTGPGGERLHGLDGIRVEIIANADHNMTPRPAREALLQILKEAVT